MDVKASLISIPDIEAFPQEERSAALKLVLELCCKQKNLIVKQANSTVPHFSLDFRHGYFTGCDTEENSLFCYSSYEYELLLYEKELY